MGRVIWTDPAIADLEDIMEYIARDSPRYALRVGERIYEAAASLKWDCALAVWCRSSMLITSARS
jgi:hypothetical protein